MSSVDPKDIQSVRSLLTTVTTFVNELGIYPRGRGIFSDAVLLAIVSKCIRLGEAICLLVESEFEAEAFGVSRTMFELALSARHIFDDPFPRSARFVHYFAKDREIWTKLIAKYYPNAKPQFSENQQKLLQIAAEIKDPHRWTGKSVRELAMEESALEIDEHGKPIKWEYDYEVIYKWTSHFVHGTVIAVDEHAVEINEPFRIITGHRNNQGGMALFNVVLYLRRALTAALTSMNYKIKQEVADEFDNVLKEFVARETSG
jgi:hypothetical protein